MKRFLQVQEPVGSGGTVCQFFRAGPHKAADQHNVRIRVQLLNLFRRPFPILARRQVQIEEND